MLVHGRDAGENAAKYAKEKTTPLPNDDEFSAIKETAEKPLHAKGGKNPAKLRREVQEAAQRYLGPIRTEEELKKFITFLEGVKKDDLFDISTTSKSRLYNKEWIDALELPNIVHLLEAAAKSALARTESRGVHFREDFPEVNNDEWLAESIVHYKAGNLEVTKRPVTVTSMTPPKGKIPYLEMMKQMMEAHSDTGGKH
jgi:succinate dehydrogenase / fumarate reductase flavoprotein subunit